jgi:hypothetical protein
VYSCPTDPTVGVSKTLSTAADWGDGDCSYAANYLCFAPWVADANSNYTFPPNGSFGNKPETNWDRKATIAASFPDGTSNTIMFCEKYARCDGQNIPGGGWWFRGVYQGASGSPGSGSDDSFPGDRMSPVFGGGIPINSPGDGNWAVGAASMFQVQPINPLVSAALGGQCDHHRPSTAHQLIQVALADGSVRAVSRNITPGTWAALLTPIAVGNERIGPDWAQQ